jgi:hypothetical protein
VERAGWRKGGSWSGSSLKFVVASQGGLTNVTAAEYQQSQYVCSRQGVQEAESTFSLLLLSPMHGHHVRSSGSRAFAKRCNTTAENNFVYFLGSNYSVLIHVACPYNEAL